MPNFVRFCLFFLALSVGACASLTPEFDPPKVTVESVDKLSSTSGGPRFGIKLRVSNPNKQALDIAGISYTLDVMGKELVSGVTNDVPLIDGYSEETVSLEAGINMFQFLRLIAGLGKNTAEEIEYRLSAKIDFNGFIPTQRVEEVGVLKL